MANSASSSLMRFSLRSSWERNIPVCSVASLVCRRRSHFSLSSRSFSLASTFTASSLSYSTERPITFKHRIQLDWKFGWNSLLLNLHYEIKSWITRKQSLEKSIQVCGQCWAARTVEAQSVWILREIVALKSSLFCAAHSCVWNRAAAPLGSPAWRKAAASGSPGRPSPLSDAYGPTSWLRRIRGGKREERSVTVRGQQN